MTESLYRLINEFYGIPYKPRFRPAAVDNTDILITRLREMDPLRYSLLLKAIRADDAYPRFEIQGILTKAAGEPGDHPTISGVASSTSVDLSGDCFAESALNDLLDLKGRASWLSHSYRIPEDVLGMVTKTSVQRGPVSKLLVEIAVAQDSPRAMASWKMIAGGIKAGLSVGVIVLASHPIDILGSRKKAMSLDRVYPLECSLVGIPANFSDAWATSASKSLRRQR